MNPLRGYAPIVLESLVSELDVLNEEGLFFLERTDWLDPWENPFAID